MGFLYKTTICRHHVKSGKHKCLIHYNGNKKLAVTWILVCSIIIQPVVDDISKYWDSDDDKKKAKKKLDTNRKLAGSK